MRALFRLSVASLFVVLAACGGGGGNNDSDHGTTATTSSVTKGDCSAAGLSAGVPTDATLPAAVTAMRADIARAAVNCDYDALRQLVDRNGKGVRFSFGDETDPIAAWRKAEADTSADTVKPLRALRLLLGLRVGKQDLGDGHVQYAWPQAHVVDAPSEAQLQEVADTGLYDMATLRRMTSGGNGYLGYRVLITPEGDWSAFVAGD